MAEQPSNSSRSVVVVNNKLPVLGNPRTNSANTPLFFVEFDVILFRNPISLLSSVVEVLFGVLFSIRLLPCGFETGVLLVPFAIVLTNLLWITFGPSPSIRCCRHKSSVA